MRSIIRHLIIVYVASASFFETFPPNVSSYKVAYLALVLEKESSTMGKEVSIFSLI